MKKNALYLVTALTAMFAYSCHKSSDNNVTPAAATFTVNGNTYTEATAADSTNVTLTPGTTYNVIGVAGYNSDKSKSAELLLIFGTATKPAAGTYKVVSGETTLTSTQVSLLAEDQVSAAVQDLYTPVGTDGVSMTVTVSSSGKISVAMPSFKTTGSKFDNTDPKNTVITTVSGTISGTVNL